MYETNSTHYSLPTTHFFTATPYPTAPLSSANQAAPAASGNSHPEKPSIFHSLRGAPSPPRANSLCPRCIVFAAPRCFVAPVAAPTAPLPSPHPVPVTAASSAALQHSPASSYSQESPALSED